MSRSPHPNGRKPSKPPAHTNSGSSSTGSRAMVWVAVAVFLPLPLTALVALGWAVWQ